MLTEILVILVVFIISWYYLTRPKNFPPGPWGIPVLGHLHRLSSEPHKKALEWKKTYGPIIGLQLGSYRTVVISDGKLIREALNMPAFAARPITKPTSDRSGGTPKGILFTSGHDWTEQRRFALQNLRDFGFGTNRMESKILDEILELMETLKREGGKPVSMQNKFNAAAVNALWSIMNGERFEQDDADLKEAVARITNSVTENNAAANLTVLMPWLAEYFPNVSGYNKLMDTFPPIIKIEKIVEKHNESYEPGSPRDFIDVYMDEVRKTRDEKSSFHKDRGFLMFSVLDLFVAGAETTSTTLSWMYVYLVNFPEKQEKLYKEIMSVVGSERLPSLSDRPKMPYTEAVINETLRYSSIIPMSVFHSTSEDVEFHGYTIPKDTLIFPNLYAANFDVGVWGDPDNFRPERFIDESGKFKKNENLLPFSTGKRVCLGESLARDELFLFTVCLFQGFQACPAGEMPSLKGTVSDVHAPKPFDIVFKERVNSLN